MIWTTFSGIYTHSEKYGIIKGQVWTAKENDHYPHAEIVGIDVNGYVIFTRSDNALIRPGKIVVHEFLKRYKLTEPVVLKAHTQNGTTYIQSFREVDGVVTMCGDLRHNYEWSRCNCKCHYVTGVKHIDDCCDGTYKLYPWAKQKTETPE
jgi:hypothetical protein